MARSRVLYVPGMNPDKLTPGERVVDVQQKLEDDRPGGRAPGSPAVAASTAVTGHLSSPADLA